MERWILQILRLTSRTTSNVMEDLEETWWEKLSTTMVRIKSTTYFRAGCPVSRPVRKVSIKPSSIKKTLYLYYLNFTQHRCGAMVWTYFKCFWKIIKRFSSRSICILFLLSLKFNVIDNDFCLYTQWQELLLGADTPRKISSFERACRSK